MSDKKDWGVYNTETESYMIGNGFKRRNSVDAVAYIAVHGSSSFLRTARATQDMADGLNKVRVHFAIDASKLPENQIFIARNWFTGEEFEPPPFTDNKWVVERKWEKES